MSDAPLETETLGALMLYSSGTTGRPKGILRAQPSSDMADLIDPFRRRQLRSYGFSDDMVYLSTAPLYHAAPLAWALQIQATGGKVARHMIPRSVDFIDRMPRLPTGKLYKQGLRERYGADAARR